MFYSVDISGGRTLYLIRFFLMLIVFTVLQYENQLILSTAGMPPSRSRFTVETKLLKWLMLIN